MATKLSSSLASEETSGSPIYVLNTKEQSQIN